MRTQEMPPSCLNMSLKGAQRYDGYSAVVAAADAVAARQLNVSSGVRTIARSALGRREHAM